MHIQYPVTLYVHVPTILSALKSVNTEPTDSTEAKLWLRLPAAGQTDPPTGG